MCQQKCQSARKSVKLTEILQKKCQTDSKTVKIKKTKILPITKALQYRYALLSKPHGVEYIQHYPFDPDAFPDVSDRMQ